MFHYYAHSSDGIHVHQGPRSRSAGAGSDRRLAILLLYGLGKLGVEDEEALLQR